MLDLAERGLLTKDPVTWSIHWMRDTVLNTLATWHIQMCTLYIKHCETRCGVVVTKGILNTSDSIRRTHQMCAWILCRCETTSDVSCVPRTAHMCMWHWLDVKHLDFRKCDRWQFSLYCDMVRVHLIRRCYTRVMTVFMWMSFCQLPFGRDTDVLKWNTGCKTR